MPQLRGLKGLIGKATNTTNSKGKAVVGKAGYLELSLSAVDTILGVSKKPPAVAKPNAKPKKIEVTHTKAELVQMIAECNNVKKLFSANPVIGKAYITKADKDIKKYQKQLDKVTGVSTNVDDTRDMTKLKQIKQAIEHLITSIEALGKDDKSWVDNSLRSSGE